MNSKDYTPRMAPSCRFNPGVECPGQKVECSKCGWSPTEQERRKGLCLDEANYITDIVVTTDGDTYSVRGLVLRREEEASNGVQA